MNTYWLLGKENYDKPLPNFDQQFKNDQPPPKRLPPTSGKPANPKVIRPSAESGFSEPETFTETAELHNLPEIGETRNDASQLPGSIPKRGSSSSLLEEPSSGLTPVDIRSDPNLDN